ncbi:MAG: RNA polymerase sigma factor [Acidobacteriota bacterium]|nr:MAG: RNA polymerase sigma factor [Acidobacteriota bacterium]
MRRAAEDYELVQRMLAGDESAFDAFFDGHFDRLVRFALPRVHHDPDLAEEIVQETLARAIHKLHSFRGEAALFTWLCTFCRREISAHFRRRGREPSRVSLVEDQPQIKQALEALSREATSAEDELRRREIVRRVHVTLDHLPDKYGRALEWKYMVGLSVHEIASRLGLSGKAAESLLTRARRAFERGFRTLSGELS